MEMRLSGPHGHKQDGIGILRHLTFCADEIAWPSQNPDKRRSVRLRAVPDGGGVVENVAKADNRRYLP